MHRALRRAMHAGRRALSNSAGDAVAKLGCWAWPRPQRAPPARSRSPASGRRRPSRSGRRATTPARPTRSSASPSGSASTSSSSQRRHKSNAIYERVEISQLRRTRVGAPEVGFPRRPGAHVALKHPRPLVEARRQRGRLRGDARHGLRRPSGVVHGGVTPPHSSTTRSAGPTLYRSRRASDPPSTTRSNSSG